MKTVAGSMNERLITALVALIVFTLPFLAVAIEHFLLGSPGWRRVSLRTMMIAVMIVTLVLGFLAYEMRN